MNTTITTVEQLLDWFEALSEADKHRAAMEMRKWVLFSAEGDIPESALVEAAEELFRTLDAEEAASPQADLGSINSCPKANR